MPHEQDREDRDRYVEQHPENADPSKEISTSVCNTDYSFRHICS